MSSKMLVRVLSIFVISAMMCCNAKSEKSLTRRKRYAVFPDSSTWSIAICTMTQAIMPNNQGIWTEAINWGIAYSLPNETSIFDHFLFPRHVSQRRSRRDLYKKMEVIMNSIGYDGRSCIYRALCEASRFFTIKGNSLPEELLRLIFKFPLQNILPSEPEDHNLYYNAHKDGFERNDKNCHEIFPQCPFSIIDVVLSGFTKF